MKILFTALKNLRRSSQSQAFATREVLYNIATASFLNIDFWSKGSKSGNELTYVNEENQSLKHAVGI